MGLPAGVEALLMDVVADGFTLYCCGPKDAPRALVACYEWDHQGSVHYVDLLTIGDFARVVTARVPTRGLPVDIFAPKRVVWAYEGPPAHAVRALLNLVHPDHPDAPTLAYPAPAGLLVPRAQQRPMTIQPPLPSRARVRADRLVTAITTPCSDTVGTAAPTGAHDRRLAADQASGPPNARSRRPAGYPPARES